MSPPARAAPPPAQSPAAFLQIPELDACVHCGLCLNACPTYRDLREEPESPRGRIHLVRAASEGRIEPNRLFADHLYLCLMCRACETACPSGVQYGRIAERARELLGPPGGPVSRGLLSAALRHLLPHPRRLRAAARLLFLYQRLRVASLVAALLPRRLREMQAMLPTVPLRFFPAGNMYPAAGERRMRVALLSGCVMAVLFPETDHATVRVLQRNGVDVHVPAGQICCGALNTHNGDAATARAMARRNIDVFLSAGVDAIVVNAAGCGAAMKEYGHLLRDDPAYAERAERVSAMTKDATELLDELGLRQPAAPLGVRVTYQDPCHLAHGQRIRRQPRALLRAAGAEVVEMEGADQCCGSAGIYNLTHPEMSARVLAEKMTQIRRAGVPLVVAPNPGCILQLRYGAARHGVAVEVIHLIDLLDRAYGPPLPTPAGA